MPKYDKLAAALRELADQSQEEPQEHRLDAAELVRVLARVCEGKEVLKAFGAPGDWGYGTPIGDALLEAYRTPKEEAPC